VSQVPQLACYECYVCSVCSLARTLGSAHKGWSSSALVDVGSGPTEAGAFCI
jgi:hypothetical protein